MRKRAEERRLPRELRRSRCARKGKKVNKREEAAASWKSTERIDFGLSAKDSIIGPNANVSSTSLLGPQDMRWRLTMTQMWTATVQQSPKGRRTTDPKSILLRRLRLDLQRILVLILCIPLKTRHVVPVLDLEISLNLKTLPESLGGLKPPIQPSFYGQVRLTPTPNLAKKKTRDAL